jgi:hypothetical protein
MRLCFIRVHVAVGLAAGSHTLLKGTPADADIESTWSAHASLT